MQKLRIYKYVVNVDDEPTIEMPEGARVLNFALQNGVSMIWCLVDPHARLVKRRFRLFGTGHVIDADDAQKYVGTVQIHIFVWHLFDIGEFNA